MDQNMDWRLTNQMEYLFGQKLLHQHYETYRPDWDHDHCAFCSVTIDNSTPLAYCTTNHYHWICENCFKDFKDLFQWDVLD